MKKRTLTLTITTLVISCAITAQQALSNPPMTTELVDKQMARISPYSENGYIFYSRLTQSEQFDKTLLRMRQRQQRLSATELTNMATLLSLSAWQEQNETKQLELFTQSDELFDLALKKSPNLWDAWMGKADLYGHSGHKATELTAIEILTELTNTDTQASTYQKTKVQELLIKLKQKHK